MPGSIVVHGPNLKQYIFNLQVTSVVFDMLCDDLGFRGCDGGDYYSASNSFIDQVVKRRRGAYLCYFAASRC